MAWKPIVVGVDASLVARAAATFGAGLAARAGARCQLVHATHEPLAPLPSVGRDGSRSAIRERARAQVVAALGAGAPVHLVQRLAVSWGAPADVLRHQVAKLGAGLIILGGKHHSALVRWVGGSTALNVARTTDVPLLVTTGGTAPLRRVLVAVDLSQAARPTLATAQRYAALFDAELRGLSVIEPLPVIPDVSQPADVESYYAMSELLLQREVWPLLGGARVETVVRRGMAVETIRRETTEWKADLLVVGSHGKSWAERLLLGSVTEQLLNQLPTALLVVPTRGAQEVAVDEARAAEGSPVVAIA
ncbi:MAG TPA: universal stress protein [Gemmatimonadales bacterium]|nr:universal stress protein [Gemmatimonadales bacterium]